MSYALSFHEGAQPAGGALHQSRAPTRDRLELHYRKIGIAAVAAALVARNFEPPSPQISLRPATPANGAGQDEPRRFF